MVNKTIVEGLRPYGLGEKLRTLRLRKSMGLVELGKHTGLSAAMLSKLERGKLFPTLPTLLRIAMVFGVGLEHFFTDERKRHVVAVVRKKERLKFPENRLDSRQAPSPTERKPHRCQTIRVLRARHPAWLGFRRSSTSRRKDGRSRARVHVDRCPQLRPRSRSLRE